MKKKATLLITNLEKIYTMQTIKQKDVIYSHAYLAMHHDVILEIGEGSYTHLLDKDTQILEGRSHFAIPAFIETEDVYKRQEVLDPNQDLTIYHQMNSWKNKTIPAGTYIIKDLFCLLYTSRCV